MKLLAYALTLLIACQSHANCDTPTRVEEGAPAPCTGYLISPETETRIRIDLTYKAALIDNLMKQNELQESIAKISEQQATNYRTQLNAERANDFWQKALYFGLGAILTGGIAYGTVQVLR